MASTMFFLVNVFRDLDAKNVSKFYVIFLLRVLILLWIRWFLVEFENRKKVLEAKKMECLGML